MGVTESALAAPDVSHGDSFSDEARDSASYAMEAAGRIAAQYRFAGLVCGITGPNDTDEDVDRAREALMEAISDFLHPEGGPLDVQMQEQYQRYLEMKDATDLYDRFGEGDALWMGIVLPGVSMGHPADTGSYAVDIARGLRAPDTSSALRRGVSPEAVAYVNQAAEAYRRANELEVARRKLASERRRQWWKSVWTSIQDYYNDKMALVREGKYLLASTKIVVDGIELFHADIAIALIAAGIIAITGGITAVMAPIIVGAVAAAVRVFKSGAGVLQRVGRASRHGEAASIFKVELYRVERSVLGQPEARPGVHYERDIDVSRDLTDNERRVLGEEDQGTTTATDDSGNTDAVSPARHLKRDQDYDEIMNILPAGTVELAASVGASKAQREARQALRDAYWAKFGTDKTMATGMTVNRPMRIIKYPPPDTIANWRGEGAPQFGAYYDPAGGLATPNELGINSVGRVKATIDVSERPGIAFQAYGDEIIDDWSVAGPNAARHTDGGVLQWHVPREYKPDMADKVEDVMTWRELPGNVHHVQAEKEGRLVQEAREGDSYPRWYLDGPAVPDSEGAR